MIVAEQSCQGCGHFTLLWKTGVRWKQRRAEVDSGKADRGRRMEKALQTRTGRQVFRQQMAEGVVCRSVKKRRRNLQVHIPASTQPGTHYKL